MRFQNVTEIEASIDDVFEFVSDMRNIPKWNYFVTKVTQETGEGPEVGARYHQTRKTDSQRYEMIHLEPGTSLIIKTLPGASPEFERHLRFEAVPNGTRLIDEMSLPTGYPGILERLAVGRVRRAVAENLGKLKELLEHGQTRLQDGRGVSLVHPGEVFADALTNRAAAVVVAHIHLSGREDVALSEGCSNSAVGAYYRDGDRLPQDEAPTTSGTGLRARAPGSTPGAPE